MIKKIDHIAFAVDNIIVSGELTGHNKNSREKYLNIGFRKAFKNLVINLISGWH